jgi:hypothetical protein
MAKRSKRKGMRRSYLKRFSNGYINTGTSPNRETLSEYSARGRSTPDPFLVTLFGLDTNKGSLPREEALALRQKILETAEPNMHIKVQETEKLKVLMYYKPGAVQVFFVQYEKTTGIVRRSLVYGTKNRALRVLRMNKVTWVHKFDAPRIT